MTKIVDMTVGNPTKHILKFAFPLILANLGQQLYMIADASIVGRGVGVKALASVGATDWCYWLILWTIIGLTQGFSTFVARYFGDKDYINTNKAIATSTVLSLIIGVILSIIGVFIAKPILNFLKTPSDIIDGAIVYLTIMLGGMIVVTAYNLASGILRAFGDGKSPLIAMLISAVLNILLDLLFVLVFKWGITGAAVASLISQLISFIYCLINISKIEFVKLDKSFFKPDFKMIKEFLKFGVPIALEYVVIGIGGIVVQSAINEKGSTFLAGYTSTNKLYGMLECSAIALGLASATFLSQNYGAKEYERVKKGVWSSVKIATIMAVIVMILMFIFKEFILELFLDINEQGGEQAFEVALIYLTIMLSCLIILYLIHVFRNALQSLKIASWPFISGIAECVCRIVMAKAVIYLMGDISLFVAEPVAWAGALLSVAIPYFFYRKKLLNEKNRD
ncbi:MAG: MATE family efflux transporter [Clostridiales bacterium]|nr:MATE family efflux transporter [Clostridiales bacterium]